MADFLKELHTSEQKKQDIESQVDFIRKRRR